ncbi:unnamed protein product [marine sediment metagenome]|uniref:Uncharacterized protein n=1 Tax=marine sediment metagenome TaxID=412755 RepID=X1DA79_9ZZZZ
MKTKEKMRKLFNEDKVKLVFEIVSCLVILNIMVWSVIGYSELIGGSSVGKITFYSVMIIFFIFKLGDLFTRGLRDVFNKRGNKQHKSIRK